MTKPSIPFVIYSLIFTLFCLSVIWFLRNFELVTEQVYIGYHGLARYNTLYAAEKFVKKMGIPSESSHSVNKLSIETLSTQNTIILKQGSTLAEFYVERML